MSLQTRITALAQRMGQEFKTLRTEYANAITSAVSAASTTDRARANHTGTQLASTISDFNTAVRTNALNQMAAPTAPLELGGQRIQGVTTPFYNSDAANKTYADAARLRSNHTGTQLASTISDFDSAVGDAVQNTMVYAEQYSGAASNGHWVITHNLSSVAPLVALFKTTGNGFEAVKIEVAWVSNSTGTGITIMPDINLDNTYWVRITR